MGLTPPLGYVASSPSPTYMPAFCAWNSLKALLLKVRCLDAPLSTYHTTLDMMLDERDETMEKAISNLDASSSTLTEASKLLQASFVAFILFSPSSKDTKKHNGQTFDPGNTWKWLSLLLGSSLTLLGPSYLTVLQFSSCRCGIHFSLLLHTCNCCQSHLIASERWETYLGHKHSGQKATKETKTHLRLWVLLHSWPLVQLLQVDYEVP